MKIKEYFQFVIGLIFGLILGIYWLLDILISKIRQWRFDINEMRSMSLILLKQKLIDEEKTKIWKNI